MNGPLPLYLLVAATYLIIGYFAAIGIAPGKGELPVRLLLLFLWPLLFAIALIWMAVKDFIIGKEE